MYFQVYGRFSSCSSTHFVFATGIGLSSYFFQIEQRELFLHLRFKDVVGTVLFIATIREVL